MGKKFFFDIIERTAWTFVQAFVGAVIILPGGIITPRNWAIGLSAGALSLGKGILATRMGSRDSAATLPARVLDKAAENVDSAIHDAAARHGAPPAAATPTQLVGTPTVVEVKGEDAAGTLVVGEGGSGSIEVVDDKGAGSSVEVISKVADAVHTAETVVDETRKVVGDVADEAGKVIRKVPGIGKFFRRRR
jgi:hypothetical protein